MTRSQSRSDTYVSRGGDKLAAALDHFNLDVAGWVCADLGSQVGGFVDCLLRRGAARVYAVDTCYGTLSWKLRRDPKVVVLERTNAMHLSLPEPVHLVTIDVGWTPQSMILPNLAKELSKYRPEPPACPADRRALARALPPATDAETPPTFIGASACVVTLIKPHYEAKRLMKNSLRTSDDTAKRLSTGSTGRPMDGTAFDGVLPDEVADEVVEQVLREISAAGWTICGTFPSPLRGHAGNREVFAMLRRGGK